MRLFIGSAVLHRIEVGLVVLLFVFNLAGVPI